MATAKRTLMRKENSMPEAKIVIDGVELTAPQAMAVRVAMLTFLKDLGENDLGEDEIGRKLSANYMKHSGEVIELIHQSIQRNK